MQYQTEQRSLLLSYFSRQPDRQMDIDDIQQAVSGISKSAIYRNLNRMVEEGRVRRFQCEGGRKFLYQFMDAPECHGHFHLTCSSCGAILHMDEDSSKALLRLVGHCADFHLDITRALLPGRCAACK